MTRREWMLNIANTTTAVGLVTIAGAETNQPAELPDGLYQPSLDHLGHVLTPERFHPIPPGCPTDYVQPRTERFEPKFFSSDEFAVIRRITELVLGDPVHEGIIEEVSEWIDLFVFSSTGVRQAAVGMDPLHRSLARAYYGKAEMQELETSDPQTICHEGLAWIAGEARSRHGGSNFVSLGTDDQVAILDAISDGRPGKSFENEGTRFFALIKAQTIRGFYTSQAGLKELDYKGNSFYARSPGCNTK